jgi:hypothetical protein
MDSTCSNCWYGTAIGVFNEVYSDNFFQGQIDNVRIYDYARTPAQVAWDYNRGLPIAEWRFDECQGSVIHDESGNGNHGTLNLGSSGITSAGTCASSSASFWYNGRTGHSNAGGSFDGVDDYILFENEVIFPDAGSAVSFWYKNNDSVENYVSFLSAGNDYAEFSLFRNNADSNIRLYINQSARDFNITKNIFNNDWHHLIIVWSAEESWGKMYIDGIFDASFSDNLYTPTVTSLRIGYNPSLDALGGQIDEVKIYNYALTPEQVKTEYNSGAVRFGN